MNTIKILALASTAFVAFATVPDAHAATELNTGHAAMAQDLQQKAAVASRKAAAHAVMARSGGSPKAAAGGMNRHCDELVARYRTEAARYSAQAAEHQQHAGAVALTREQHLALAQDFDTRATVANQKVAEHEVMSRSASPKGSKRAMSNHCERLIAQYRAEADEYAAKAAGHRLAAR